MAKTPNELVKTWGEDLNDTYNKEFFKQANGDKEQFIQHSINRFGIPRGSSREKEIKYYGDVFDKMANKQEYVPFALDTKKYPDVQTTPYGFIYNVGNQSITDLSEQDARLFRKPATKSKGFSLTVDGDEVFYPDFESAYKAAKGIN